MSLQNIVISVDVPDDESTAVESAAAAAVSSLQDAGVVVTAASFGGTSLLPSPAEVLRAAIDALQSLTGGSARPSAADLAAAVAKVDDAARVVEAATPAAPAAGPVGPVGPAAPTALPDEPAAVPTAEPADAAA